MNLDDKIKEYLKIREHDTPPYCGPVRTRRADFINILKIAEAKFGVEIGVNKGNHALALFKALPRLNLTCVDPWKAYDKRGSQKRQDACYKIARDQLKFYDVCFVRDSSTNAVRIFDNEFLDFVYIDGDHRFDFCMNDLIAWAPKVKIGGIIAGHDYAHHHTFGVIEAVNAYTRAHNVSDWYIIKSKQPTYFWVKKHND
jgi:hypothetical protein